MRKLYSLVLIGLLLVLSSIVIAPQQTTGTVYDVDLFQLNSVKTINEGDIIRFNFPVRVYKNPNNTKGDYYLEERSVKFHIREIMPKLVRTTLFIQGESVPIYLDVPLDKSDASAILKLDFEKDGIQDLGIVLFVEPRLRKQVAVGFKINKNANYCNDNGVCEDDENPKCWDCTGNKISAVVVKDNKGGFLYDNRKIIIGVSAALIFFLLAYLFITNRNILKF